MPESAPNVLRVNQVEETADYRRAIADIIRRVQNAFDLTHIEIAEKIDVSVGTISNAANKKADLNPLYLKRLGQVFGPHTLDPYLALFQARAVPLNPDEVDPLPSLTMAAHAIALARCPNSPGGISETHREKLDMLPALERAQSDLTAKVVSIRTGAAA